MRTLTLIFITACFLLSCKNGLNKDSGGVEYILHVTPGDASSGLLDYTTQQIIDYVIDFGKSRTDTGTFHLSDFKMYPYPDTAGDPLFLRPDWV